MPSGEQAYAFAKACGIIGKSFVGKRLSRLRSVGRLTELDRLVFPQSSRELPERELLRDLERRIIDRSVNQITLIVESFAKPPELLILLIKAYEYGDVKNALAGIVEKKFNKPEFTKLGPFGTVDFDAYPNLKDMLRGTEFAFLLDVDIPQKEEEQDEEFLHLLQMELDLRYYARLWNSLFSLAPTDRKFIEKILSEEIALRNAVWSLRLRTYYGMDPHKTEQFLIPIGIGRRYDPEAAAGSPPGGGKNLADDARSSLSMALDHRPDWQKWKRVEFLNPEIGDVHWRVDPRYFQNAASEYLYHLARRSFYRTPFTIDSIACFIKLKQFEEDLLTSVAEGLGLGLSAEDIFSMLEVVP